MRFQAPPIALRRVGAQPQAQPQAVRCISASNRRRYMTFGIIRRQT